MKPRRLLIILFPLLILTITSVGVAYLADYALPSWTVDAGGGISTNAQYTLSGTIGQPDAGMLSGGEYSLMGGFWGGGRLTTGQFFLPIISR
jgi:hypothetical protein